MADELKSIRWNILSSQIQISWCTESTPSEKAPPPLNVILQMNNGEFTVNVCVNMSQKVMKSQYLCVYI